MAMMKYSSSTSVNQINKSSQWGKVKSASLRDEEEKKLKELQKNPSK